MAPRGKFVKRVDLNQREIVEALRKAGYSVQSLASVGKGCPDLAVGKHGRTWLLEIKRPRKVCTPYEQDWQANWKGHVCTVRSIEEALAECAL